MDTMMTLWSRVLKAAAMLSLMDILDIVIVAFLVYKLLQLVNSRSASQIVKAIALLMVMLYISGVLGLNTVNYIVGKTFEVGLIALVVVFQPELRRLLERVGGSSLKGLVTPKTQVGDTEKIINQTVSACRSMSRQKVGALIVFERGNKLDDYFKTGTIVDAELSAELLKNIFFPKAALHDGAVVVRNGRIAAAGCVLPLTENPNLSRDLGTRHRAAIGVSEHSDSIVVVVSEETGVISCAMGGSLKRYMTPETLTKLLTEELSEETKAPIHHKMRDYVKKLLPEKNGDRHEDK